MGEHEKQPFESETTDQIESRCTKSEAGENAAWKRPASDWEGYSLEILSVWFDP